MILTPEQRYSSRFMHHRYRRVLTLLRARLATVTAVMQMAGLPTTASYYGASLANHVELLTTSLNSIDTLQHPHDFATHVRITNSYANLAHSISHRLYTELGKDIDAAVCQQVDTALVPFRRAARRMNALQQHCSFCYTSWLPLTPK